MAPPSNIDTQTLYLMGEVCEAAWDRLWHTEVHDRWSEIMNQLMEFTPEGIVDSSPVTEVFHLETGGREG